MYFNNRIMSVRARVKYDSTCFTIRDKIGSFETIARRANALVHEDVSGETFRRWFTERSIPVDYCFVLYEVMDREIDPFTLQPWLVRYFEEVEIIK